MKNDDAARKQKRVKQKLLKIKDHIREIFALHCNTMNFSCIVINYQSRTRYILQTSIYGTLHLRYMIALFPLVSFFLFSYP